jgi:transcriptional regulator with XRE-family HTH domain
MPQPEKQLEPEKGLHEWFGAELRTFRHMRDLSQEELGLRVHCSGAKIGKLEKAERRCDPALAAALDRALETGGVLSRAWSLVQAQADKTRSQADKSERPRAELAEHPIIGEILDEHSSIAPGESVDRRTFLATGAGMAASLAFVAETGPIEGTQLDLIDQVNQIAAACIRMGRQRRIGRADLTRLNAIHSLYQSLDYQYGGGMVYQSMNQVADAAAALLDAGYPDKLRNELFATVANLRLLAGWTSFDMCDHSAGQRHFAAAERLALMSGNTNLGLYVHYCQARQLQHLRHNRDAIEVLRLATDRIGSEATPGATAVLNATIAPSLAALGDRQGALSSLNLAETAFEHVEPANEPECIRWLDRAELDAQYGRVFRDFARQDRQFSDEAAEWTRRAIEGFDEGMQRSSALNRVGLCSAWFLAGEPDKALEIGTSLVNGQTQVLSQRVRERIANVKRDAKQCAGSSDVDDFVHVIAKS